ncbi:MAG TPA: hypothetical protein VFZ09_17175 [Archangium sp.]|uniref:hypothetical protein n=1 Tax=Archangium sp. TaxID=1872627 RepID=UPI002E2EDF8A|nr:hypothetical protein [Archangium sp.]HEX5747977.1 hypothetical protein [Archangium sp.]
MGYSLRHIALITLFLWSCSSSGGQSAPSLPHTSQAASGRDAGQAVSGQSLVDSASGNKNQDVKIEKELEKRGLLLARDKAGSWYLGTRIEGKLLLSKSFASSDEAVDLSEEETRQQAVLTIQYTDEKATRTSHVVATTKYSLDVDHLADRFVVRRWKVHRSLADMMAADPRQEKFTEVAVDLAGRMVTKTSGIKGEGVPSQKTSSSGAQSDVKAPLLVVGNSFDEKQAFRDFVPVYGAKNLKDDGDLSAQLMMRWDAERIHFKVKVLDDFVLFGKGIHTDHFELWGLPKGGGQQLVYFDKNEEIWLVPADSPESRQPLNGEYMLMEDGYEVKFELPYFLYSMSDSLKGNEVLDATIVISDADRDRKQETLIGTSLVNAKPWTWGKIYLQGKQEWPELSAEFIASMH